MGCLGELGFPPLHGRLYPPLLTVVGPAALLVLQQDQVRHQAVTHRAPALNLQLWNHQKH